jgi:hypothetical protein
MVCATASWQRHSEPGPAARAEAVVAPPGTNRPGCARSRQGTEFAESRFRASRVTFVRRQRPYRRSPRSRSSGYCSARAKRSSHRCRDKRCSVSSIGEEMGGLGLMPARPMSATAAECLLPVTSQAIRKRVRAAPVDARRGTRVYGKAQLRARRHPRRSADDAERPEIGDEQVARPCGHGTSFPSDTQLSRV